MNTAPLLFVTAAATLAASASAQVLYQGRLDDAAAPAEGAFDFRVELYDAGAGGASIAGPFVVEDVDVDRGVFMFELPFPDDAFGERPRFLAVGVRPGASTGAFDLFPERQPVGVAPFSLNADEVSGIEPTPFLGSGIPASIPTDIALESPVADIPGGLELVAIAEFDDTTGPSQGGGLSGIVVLRQPYPSAQSLLDVLNPAAASAISVEFIAGSGKDADVFTISNGSPRNFEYTIGDDGGVVETLSIVYSQAGLSLVRDLPDRSGLTPPTLAQQTGLNPGNGVATPVDFAGDPIPNAIVTGQAGGLLLAPGSPFVEALPMNLRVNFVETALDGLLTGSAMPEIGVRLFPSGDELRPRSDSAATRFRIVPTDDGKWVLEYDVIGV